MKKEQFVSEILSAEEYRERLLKLLQSDAGIVSQFTIQDKRLIITHAIQRNFPFKFIRPFLKKDTRDILIRHLPEDYWSRMSITAFAAQNGRLDIIQYLYKQYLYRAYSPPGEFFLNPVLQGSLLDHRTPMWFAASNGHLPVVQWLYEETEAKQYIRGYFSYNSYQAESPPMFVAAENGHLPVVQWLYENTEAKADASKSKLNDKPVTMAAANGHLDIVRYLCEKARANTCHTYTKTEASREDIDRALFLAVREGHPAVVKYLCEEANADVRKPYSYMLPLFVAAEHGHLGVVQYLCRETEAKEDVSRRDHNGRTPLFLAASNGHCAVVQYLHEEVGADVHKRDKYKHTPLLAAAMGGHRAVVRYLGATVSTANDMRHALLCAVEYGRLGVVKDLYRYRGPDDDEILMRKASESKNINLVLWLYNKIAPGQPGNEGRTPMHIAAKNGHLTALKLLHFTKKGKEEICAQCGNGWTPMLNAASEGHLEVMKWFYDDTQAKTDVCTPNKKGQTPLHMAAERGHYDVVKWLCKKTEAKNMMDAPDNKDRTPRKILEEKGDVKILQWLYNQTLVKEHLRLTDDRGWTSMHNAAQDGAVNMIQALCSTEAKEDLYTFTHSGLLPIHIAAQYGHLEILKLFDEHMALSICDKNNQTPMHIAAQYGHLEIFQWLLKRPQLQQDIFRFNNDGFMPIHLAIRYGQLAIVKVLTESVFLNQILDHAGRTLMFVAAEFGQTEILDYLFQFEGLKEDVFRADKEGFLPIHLAAKKGQIGAMEWLCAKAPQTVNARNEKSSFMQTMSLMYDRMRAGFFQPQSVFLNLGLMPLHVAIEAGNLEAVQWLCEHGADHDARTHQGTAKELAEAHGFTDIVAFLDSIPVSQDVAVIEMQQASELGEEGEDVKEGMLVPQDGRACACHHFSVGDPRVIEFIFADARLKLREFDKRQDLMLRPYLFEYLVAFQQQITNMITGARAIHSNLVSSKSSMKLVHATNGVKRITSIIDTVPAIGPFVKILIDSAVDAGQVATDHLLEHRLLKRTGRLLRLASNPSMLTEVAFIVAYSQETNVSQIAIQYRASAATSSNVEKLLEKIRRLAISDADRLLNAILLGKVNESAKAGQLAKVALAERPLKLPPLEGCRVEKVKGALSELPAKEELEEWSSLDEKQPADDSEHGSSGNLSNGDLMRQLYRLQEDNEELHQEVSQLKKEKQMMSAKAQADLAAEQAKQGEMLQQMMLMVQVLQKKMTAVEQENTELKQRLDQAGVGVSFEL